MNWGDLLFGFQGRINRAKYWLAVLVYLVVSVIMALIGLVLGPESISMSILQIVVGIGTFISGLAIGIKRLHDRNKTGWWLLIFYIAPGVLFGAGAVMGIMGMASESMAGSAGAIILSLAGLAIVVWAFVQLGCLRGSVGVNDYGPDPLAAAA